MASQNKTDWIHSRGVLYQNSA